MFFLFGVVYSQNQTNISLTWSNSVQYLGDDVYFEFPQFDNDYFELNIPNKTIGFSYLFKSNGFVDSSSLEINSIKW